MGIFSRRSKLESYTEPEYADLMTEARERFKAAAEADEMQRLLELDDLRFCDPDGQWPADIRGQRDADGRPCLTVDRLTPFVHQIVNEQRQNRPQPSVNPVGDGADKQTAEIFQGMVRHISYMSNGDTAIDTAFESQVRCGRGYFRVLTEFVDDQSFDQDVVIKRIPNLHNVYLDPSATEPDGSDMEYGFITTYIPRSVYRHEYPKSKLATLTVNDWKSIGDEAPEWAQRDGSAVMVLEYYRKVRKPVTVYRLDDGTTTIEKPEAYADSRVSVQVEIQWFKMNAIEILDQTIWAGKYIPIVPVYGTELLIDGIRTWSGLIRSAKDAQRAFNYWKSAQAETIALAPKAPWVGPKGFMGNMRNIWQNANKRPLSVLEYEAFDSQQRPLNPPTRTMVEPPIQAITMAMQGAIDDLKGTTGMYDANLGNREGGQSGVAIRQLQRQGQAGSYHYADNLARSIRHLGRILIDLIPKIYDTERTVRIVKPDESSDLVKINGPTGEQDEKTGMEKVYDLKVGTYDVTVSVGPGYQTKRQENLALLESLMQGPFGQLLTQAAPDLVASMMDFQIAPELVERLKKILPPQLQDQPKGPGQQPIPPQVQQMMAAVQQKEQQTGQMIEQMTAKIHELMDQIEDNQAKADAEMAKAQLDSRTKVKIAQMDNETKLLIQRELLAAKGADEAVQAKIAELEQSQEELAELALYLNTVIGSPAEAPEPVEPAEPKEVKPDPTHMLMEGHTAALQSIAEALKRSSGPRKRTIQTGPDGTPVGLLDEPGEE